MPLLIFIIALVIIISRSSIVIGSGKAGVLYKTFSKGVVTDKPPLTEGFHLVAPWNRVFVYEVRQQELYEQMKVLSSNGLEIQIEATAWYQPKYESLGKLHKEKSEQYKERVLQPAIRSAARSVIGRYTPEQLYSEKRDAIQKEIFEETKEIVEDQYIQLNEILVRDITLPESIRDAIERKLKQEQAALEYEFRNRAATLEADRQRIEAQGKADANRILNASLSDNILREKGIEATLKLAESPNAKIVVVGSGENGLPLILGNN